MDIKQLLIVSHSLGIDLFCAIISNKKKDKQLPAEFYRNRFNASVNHSDYPILEELVKLGIMEQWQPDWYYVTDHGISEFKKEFAKCAMYKPVPERDVQYLKDKIDFYVEFYGFGLVCGYPISQFIIEEYLYCYLEGGYVGKETLQIIRKFKKELSNLYKPKKIKV